MKNKEQIDCELDLCKRLLLELDVGDKQVIILGVILSLIENLIKEKDA